MLELSRPREDGEVKLQELRRWGRGELAFLSSLPPPSHVPPETVLLEVDVLLMHALNLSRIELLASPEQPVSAEQRQAFAELISRRRQSEPIAYIIGRREFYGREFLVNRHVLIPRPETELLVECAVRQLIFQARREFLLIDIGTGSGAIAVSVLCELRERLGKDRLDQGLALATDRKQAALLVARKNAEAYGVLSNICFVCGDLARALHLAGRGLPPLIVANLPYVADEEVLPRDVEDYEPREALRAGPRGLDQISELIPQLALSVSQGAHLFLEIGDSQSVEVESLLNSAGLPRCVFHQDLRGVPRIVEVCREE